MLRSICIVSREYPPETAWGGIARSYEMLARGLAAQGVAVHVISLDTTGTQRRIRQDGTVVYRLSDAAAPGSSVDVQQLLWAERVAAFYAELDDKVGFDVVLAPEYGAETLRLVPGPHTALVTRLDSGKALVHPARCSVRTDPAFALAAQMELTAIARADAVIAPSRLVADRSAALVAHTSTVLPSVFDASAFARVTAPREDLLELVFVGRLEPHKVPEVALHCVAELVRRGERAHLTFVGRDTPTAPGGGSYRRGVLRPAMAALGLDAGHVRFVEQLDPDGVRAHLSVASAAILPSRFESLQNAALEALSVGLPTFVGTDVGLTEWVSPDDGLVPGPVDEPERFATIVAERLADEPWRRAIGARAVARVKEIFDPALAARAHVTFFESCLRPAARRRRQGPKIGVVMLAHNALAYTKRAVASVLAHTEVPLRLVVVDNASSDGTREWLRTLDDERLAVVESAENRGVPAGRNLGLDHLDGDEDYVCFLDNDVEVFSHWWERSVAIFERDPQVGVVGEDGVIVSWSDAGRELIGSPEPGGRCDIAVGFCMFVRPQTLARVGRFDEGLGLFWHDDDDFCFRATRIGEHVVAARSERVVHFEHRSSAEVGGLWESAEESRPSQLSARNQEYLARKRRAQQVSARSPFLVLAGFEDVIEHPHVLADYGVAFERADDCALVVFGTCPPAEHDAALARLEAAASSVGFDLEAGAKLVLMLPEAANDEERAALIAEAHAVLSPTRPNGSLAHLAWFTTGAPLALRALAERVWAARPPSVPADPVPVAA